MSEQNLTDLLDQFGDQRTTEGLREDANKGMVIPIGTYDATFTPRGGEKEPDDTEYGCPGRLVILFEAKLKDGDKEYREPFFRTSPEDYRKNRETGEWLAEGEAGHKQLKQDQAATKWGWLTKYDKKNEYLVKEHVQMIQERSYKVKVGHIMEHPKDPDAKNRYVSKPDKAQAAIADGYVVKRHFVQNVWEPKDTAR